ncbi:hypothetical protein BDR07DRAFT_1382587 [Suillus spraguei]|nr:hypothetical protein BDR07DRAFT_1382587 [Suillus spraguei]
MKFISLINIIMCAAILARIIACYLHLHSSMGQVVDLIAYGGYKFVRSPQPRPAQNTLVFFDASFPILNTLLTLTCVAPLPPLSGLSRLTRTHQRRVYGYFSEGKHLEERTQSMPVLHSVNPTSRRPAFSVPANVFLRNETIHGTSAECLTKHSKPILQSSISLIDVRTDCHERVVARSTNAQTVEESLQHECGVIKS